MPSPGPQAGYEVSSRPVAGGTPADGSAGNGSRDEGTAGAAGPQAAAPGANTALTAAEMREIGDLLRAIGLEPGAVPVGGPQAGTAFEDAIRSYQEMAGLTVDGQASPALLSELRAVASLYGGG